ncbi:F-box domain protein [Trichostrongylus colubriformis]|uniref:F-box domain protein n=1 Tax=Trichostrongylus colubriformis TaxID=6319 RepID=A0AAN8IUE5_TRICO
MRCLLQVPVKRTVEAASDNLALWQLTDHYRPLNSSEELQIRDKGVWAMASSVNRKPTLQRKDTFPCLAHATSHDFRKEYQNSELERFRRKKPDRIDSSRLQNAWRTFADYFFSRSKRRAPMDSNNSPSNLSYIERLPSELVFKILDDIQDKTTLLNCRAVCKRWHNVVDKLSMNTDEFKPIELSRLVVSGLPRRAIEIRRVNYGSQRSSAIVLSHAALRHSAQLTFSFRQFKIQRLMLKNMALTDELVDFLRMQLLNSDLSSLNQLSLHEVDFHNSNSLTLHRLLALVAKHLETFELTQSTGMRADSVTDAHLAQLDPTKIRRITIDGVRFATPRRRALRVSDDTLRQLAKQKSFPTLVLDRCSVTTKAICDYTEGWFVSAHASEKRLRSQICTVKRCAGVRGPQFEAECKKRGLQCKHRRGSGSLILYNVQAEHSQTEFTVATQPLDAEEPKKND